MVYLPHASYCSSKLWRDVRAVGGVFPPSERTKPVGMIYLQALVYIPSLPRDSSTPLTAANLGSWYIAAKTKSGLEINIGVCGPPLDPGGSPERAKSVNDTRVKNGTGVALESRMIALKGAFVAGGCFTVDRNARVGGGVT